MKKLISLSLVLCMCFALFACGQKAEPAPAEPEAAETEEAAEPEAEAAEPEAETAGAEAAPAEGQTVLKLWCIATESDANRPAYLQAIADYEAAHPDVKIEMEAFENESYKTKIKAAMMGNDTSDLPDIFFSWSGAFLGEFVNAGRAYCLDENFKAYEGQLPESMLSTTTYDGKHYGVPTTFNIVAMYANMDLLKQAGWEEIPTTYEDLTKCCDDLLANGIIPFGCAGKETWCVTEYLEPIMLKSIGYEALNSIFAGEATWNDPDIAKSVDIMQEMIDKGYFDPNGAALGNDEVKANFLQGKTAFYQNGSWNTGEVAAADFEAGVALFPVMNEERSSYYQLIGGPSDVLAVCAASENVDLAAEVAVALGKEICHYNYLNAVGMPAWIPDYDTSELSPLLVQIADLVGQSEGMVLFGDTAMAADPAQVYLDYVSQVYGGDIDGQGFIDGLTNDLQ